MKIENICVFCGSNTGKNPAYLEHALQLAQHIAERGFGLVYGGGTRGLMGEVALCAKKHGARITGVSPKRFHKQGSITFEVDEYILVDTMHERKAAMYKKSQAFVVLPGGMGTLDELAEIVTWQHIGFNSKPVAIYNICGFFDPLLAMLRKMREEGFINAEKLEHLKVTQNTDELFDFFENFEALDAPWESK